MRGIGFVADVATARGVFIALLFRGLAEQCHVEQVRLAGVDEVDLLRRQFGRDQVGLDGVCMAAVVGPGQVAADVPAQLLVLRLFQALEFLDQVNFEFGANPHAEFKGDVFVGISSAITSGLGHQSDGIGLGYPFLDAELVVVEPSLSFNCGESAIIKFRVMNLFSDADEFHGVAVAQPVGDEKVPILGFEHVRKRDEILVAIRIDRDGCALHVDFRQVQSPYRAASSLTVVGG